MADWTVGFAFCFGSCCFTKLPYGYVSAQPKALEGGNIPLHPIRRLQISVKESQLWHILVNICNTKENPMVHSTNFRFKTKISILPNLGSYFLLSLKLLSKFHGHLSVGEGGVSVNWTPPPPSSSKPRIWEARDARSLRRPAEGLQGCEGCTKTRLLAGDVRLQGLIYKLQNIRQMKLGHACAFCHSKLISNFLVYIFPPVLYSFMDNQFGEVPLDHPYRAERSYFCIAGWKKAC